MSTPTSSSSSDPRLAAVVLGVGVKACLAEVGYGDRGRDAGLGRVQPHMQQVGARQCHCSR
jgi:hypothetical protein